MLSFLPGLLCCSCSAPYSSVISKPKAFPMSSQDAFFAYDSHFLSRALHTLWMLFCGLSWSPAPHDACTCLCYQFPMWPLEYFHLLTMQWFYTTLASNLHPRSVPCILMHNAFGDAVCVPPRKIWSYCSHGRSFFNS